MSKLGNIQESYGKPIGIAVANTYGETLLASSILPKNNIIIASPVDNDANDVGTYAMFITDNEGTPIRLTYTIQTGNGLNSNETDIIKLDIDNKTLQTDSNGSLYVATNDIIGNTLSINDSNNLFVNTENLNIANEEQLGVVGIDNETVKTNQSGNIYVDTENLDRANDNQVGVVKSDNKTININSHGIISVRTFNLSYGNSYSPGVVKGDGITISTSYGDIKVNTSRLNYATSNSFGISKCDNYTILVNNGVYSVKTNNLLKGSQSNYGVVKTDGISTVINNDLVTINNYDNILDRIDNIKTRINAVKNNIDKLSHSVTITKSPIITDPTIFTFMCNSVTSVNLTRPKYGTFPNDFLSEKITAEFTVNTNCPFIITVTYLDNESPSIYLYGINYDDLDTYPGEVGLYNEYQSTNGVDKILRFSWMCKNYASSNGGESLSTRIKITISYSKENNVSQTVYYNIVRYNSLYKKEKIDKFILTPISSDGKLIIETSQIKGKHIKKKNQTT